MTKIAVFGVSGQLGRDIASALSSHEVHGVDHARADIRDEAAVRAALDVLSPAWVINCAAMTHVDGCETDPTAAFQINALGARNIARAAAAHGARVVQISTDYVFDGRKSGAYLESDLPAPVNAYGVTKLAGEHFASFESANTMVVRTSGLYGTHTCRGKGGNFVETMMTRAAAGGPLKVVTDERLTPTFTADLAVQLRVMIESDAPAGVYHATNGGGCSWHEFTEELFRQAGVKAGVERIRAAEWKSPTRRPANSVLENGALQSLGIDRMPEWRDALARYLAARTAAR